MKNKQTSATYKSSEHDWGNTPGWNISGLQPVSFHDALKGLHNIAQWQRLGWENEIPLKPRPVRAI